MKQNCFQGQKHERLVVAAIDLGTFGSGFALCTLADYKRDPTKISVHTWNSETAITNKEPTTVLINPNGKDCMSFGYNAERVCGLGTCRTKETLSFPAIQNEVVQ